MRRTLLPGALILFASAFAANAVGFKTQLNCASDYYAFCSSHPVGSPGVRKCMSDNGPKLSKSCINALIADGEISKDEVARRAEKIAPPKATAKAERKAAEQQPKRVAARDPEVKQLARPQPSLVRDAVTLDQPTFVALKNRGPHFVSDPDTESAAISAQAESQTLSAAGEIAAVERAADSTERLAEASVAVQPVSQSEKKIPSKVDAPANLIKTPAKNLKPVVAVQSKKAEAVPADASKTAKMSGKRIKLSDYRRGKMSLGKKQSSEQPDAMKPASSDTWIEYMKSRFSGSMNYEGPDAHFSKGE